MAHNYEHLDIWKKSIDLAVTVYRVSSKFPREELYGLTTQIRRSAVSISSNIAEGAGRGSKKEFLRFVLIALGSLNEVESQLHVARKLGFLSDEEFREVSAQARELGSFLGGFRNYLKK